MDIHISIYEEFPVQKFSEAAYCLPTLWLGRIWFTDELLPINLHSFVNTAAVGQQQVRVKQTRVCALTIL